jgi:hypothetical protein
VQLISETVQVFQSKDNNLAVYRTSESSALMDHGRIENQSTHGSLQEEKATRHPSLMHGVYKLHAKPISKIDKELLHVRQINQSVK